MKKFWSYFQQIGIIIAGFLYLAKPAFAVTNWTLNECYVLPPETDATAVVTLRGITCVIRNLIQPIPSLVILAAASMVIFAGIRIMSAGSDPKALSSAYQTLTWAIIGVVLLSGAWLLLVTIKTFTGADILQFGLPN